MDEFAEKRNMVKMLLDMLKQSAVSEMEGGTKAPEGLPADAKGLEIEKVSMIPGDKEDMDKVDSDAPEAATMADDVMHKVEPEMVESHDEPMEDEDPMPAFSMLMKRKGMK